MNTNTVAAEKETDTKQEVVTFDLEKKYPELTTEYWRKVLEFAIIVKNELGVYDAELVPLIIALVKNC